ncbi:tRNA pseudouridine(38-40) synthase TruA [Agromyces sp. C10]|uniref:tRNA pseudouridine(38-40) synthase TruA n=1 Tax=Agromyces sp. C10 TaxID=2935077 RepID=UPI00200A2AC7|nr:tRNA pseudouridine(38-40) synthase TruA [Agromyces sp. C10]MCK8609099.1 tRNA pseudouridine(38-40) synthase TruA [Agromyces sp. C10]
MNEATTTAGVDGDADAAASVVRLRLDLAYDGTAFAGWSRQPGLRTVQGTIERALETLFRREGVAPRLVVAGRTDAGVHATGQVAHLDVDRAAFRAVARPRRGVAESDPHADPGAVLVRRLRGVLGSTDDDVVVRSVRPAPEGFDARFSAVWRRYEYRIADADAEHDPLQRHRTVWYPRELDVEAMDVAAQTLVGLGDFAAFCKPREGATTIRTLQSFRWRRASDGVLVASLQADAFCHSMVRALVGSGVAVGEGRLRVEQPGELMHARTRTSAFKVLPAKGLTLTEVGYPPEEDLAARAEQTRARRELHVDGVVG